MEESSRAAKRNTVGQRALRWLAEHSGFKRLTGLRSQNSTLSSNTKRVGVVSVDGSLSQGKLYIWTMNIPTVQADQFEEYSAHIVIPDWSVDLSPTNERNSSQTTLEILQRLKPWVEWWLLLEDQEKRDSQERERDEDY